MHRINTLNDLILIAEKLIEYLLIKHVKFNNNGFPIFERQWFLAEWPELIVTFPNRNNLKIVKNKANTVICLYMDDSANYCRLSNVIEEIDQYKGFMGVIGSDITVTKDMDKEWQEIILLINQLFLCVLAVNGIKIIFNIRCEGELYKEAFSGIPKNIMTASSSLGCDNAKSPLEAQQFIDKLLFLLSSKHILYGKTDEITENCMDVVGINYKKYKDMHSLLKEMYNNGFKK